MAGERMIPALPCASIDEIADFYSSLGFDITYRQVRPNPYLALRRDDLEVHYFGMDGFRPEDSYSTCLVMVDDTAPLYEAFAAGLRAAYGKLPLAGLPRITRPRRRKNADYLSGFSLIDPSGNWIRVFRSDSAGRDDEAPEGRLADALANAVVLADSHGDEAQAEKVLAGAYRRAGAEETAVRRVQVLAYLAELAIRLGREDRARERLAELEGLALTDAERDAAGPALREAGELAASLTG